MVEYLGGRFGQAIAHYDKARSLTPEQVLWPLLMAQAAASGGDHERVRDILRRWAVPPASHPIAALPHMLKEATLGERTLLDRTLDDAYRAKLWPDLQYCHSMSQIFALVGAVDEGLHWLEQSARRGWIPYPFLAERDRALDNLRADPRFGALLNRVHEEWTGFRARFGQSEG